MKKKKIIKYGVLILIIIFIISIFYIWRESVFIYLIWGFIFFFIGYFSAIVIHELFHLIVIKMSIYINTCKKDLNLLNSKSLWRQPYGIVLLSGYMGNIVYLIIIIPIFYLIRIGYFPINQSFFFLFGAIFCNFLVLVIIPDQSKKKIGDIYRYTKIKELLKKGCSCGSQQLLLGRADIKCNECGKNVFKFKKYSKKEISSVTPAHLNPFYLFSKKKDKFSVSIDINAPTKKVFNYLLSDYSEAYKKKFKICKYERHSTNKVTFFSKAFKITKNLVNSNKYNRIEFEYQVGAEIEKVIYDLKEINGKTKVELIQELPFNYSQIIVEGKMRKELEFQKDEVENKSKKIYC